MEITFYQHLLSEYLGKPTTIKEVHSLSGGCINDVVKVITSEGIFCVKSNKASLYPSMFEKEAKGLLELRKADCIEVPEPLAVGEWEGSQYLILNFIASGLRVSDFWEDFGRSLAWLHKNRNASFGWTTDNYIGSLPQLNQWEENGIEFFIKKRLAPQLSLAEEKDLIGPEIQTAFEKLYHKLPHLLPSITPSLLHGDLWSGNYMVGSQGKAALIDPAVYYGPAEAELAFTKLFGGFEEEFYEAYLEINRLENGYQERFDLYNLYPLLVHLNLFGRSYLAGIVQVLKKYS